MKAKIYFYIGDFDDSIILEDKDKDELIAKINSELSQRGAHSSGAEILEY